LVFCAIARVTVAGPLPLDALVTAIQLTAEDAVHVHSALVDKPTATLDGDGPTDTPLLESAEIQLLPACETVKLRPPIVSVPTREKDAVLGDTVYCTVPSPSPGEPAAIVIHGTLLEAVQPQPSELDTSIVPVDPAALIEIEVGVRLYEHAAPACVTVSVSPPIVTVPVRVDVVGFDATL
jgi:hypothetical protein